MDDPDSYNTDYEMDSDLDLEYSQRLRRSVSGVNADSMINQFTPCYSLDSKDIGKDIVNEMIDNILLMKGGEFEGSSTECSTIRAESEPVTGSSRDIGQRISYWQRYLKEHARISDKISRATGKDPTELLLNRTEDYRKQQQCKTIMDVAERLYPENVAGKYPITSKRVPCVPDIYETLPLQDRLRKPLFTITDMPKATLQEQGMYKYQFAKASWFHSNYLGEKLMRTQNQIKRVLDHMPDTEHLQVVGRKIVPTEPKPIETSDLIESEHVDFRVTDAWYRCKEPSLEYVITVENQEFDAEQKCNNNVNFGFTFECKPFEKQIRKLTIRNKGWKAVDIAWTRVKQKRLRCLPQTGMVYPAFYFNKNLTRVQPGCTSTIEFIFCCKEFGVYEECWEIKLIPKFLAGKCKMTVSLFGQCDINPRDQDEFHRINNNFKERAAKQIAHEVIYEVATYARREPAIPKPYYLQFTEHELFKIVNPDLNYSEDCVEQLKDMYFELVEQDFAKPCKQWYFDLQELKGIILNIADEVQRKEYFKKFNLMVTEMRMNNVVFRPNYEDQKQLLVKNVLLALADSMEKTIVILHESIFKTQYDLNFDEVLVTNARFKQINALDNKDGSEDSGLDDDAKSTCVVKSELVRKKKKEAFEESLYIHTYGQLCTAVEQIVSIIEGIKCL